MKKIGDMWIRDNDPFFEKVFSKTGDDFELDHLKEALKHVTTYRLALDIGANYGSWTRYMASKFHTVLAFEPVANTYDCLVENTKHLNNVSLINKAVGDTEKFVDVGIGKMYDNIGMFTVIGEGNIPMITVDSLKLTDVDLIKLDIEGYELFALRGAENTLVRCKPVVIFEENVRCEVEHNVKQGAVGDYLSSLGAKQVGRVRNDLIYSWD